MSKISQYISTALKSGKVWVIIMMYIGAQQTIGTLYSILIVNKFINTTYVYQGPYYKLNFHPYIQTINMFIGQMLSLIIFYIWRYRKPQKIQQKQRQAVKKGKKVNMNKLWLFIPAFFDLLTSMMQYIAFNFISASAYQIFKGGTIITTFLFSVTFLKQSVTKKQIFGSLFALFGIVIVGLANIIFSKPSTSHSDNTFLQFIGYTLMIASLFTNGFFFVFQQKLLNIYHIQSLQIVGFEGVFGFCLCLILIPILCYIPCAFGISACVYTHQGYPYIQGFTVYIHQLSQNPVLIFLGILSILGILLFNVSGVTVTKYINALARAIANLSKSIVVWIISFIITVTAGSKYHNLKWEKLDVYIIIMQIIGFIFMALGNLIYVGIIKLPEKKKPIALEEQQQSGSEQIIQPLLDNNTDNSKQNTPNNKTNEKLGLIQ